MDRRLYDSCVSIIHSELKVALGCTEPIAIAYAAAKARAVLGELPDKVHVLCSGNIIKNVMGVTVPNSGGLKGIAPAAVLGIVGGNEKLELAVLETATDEDRAKTRELLKDKDYCRCDLIEGVDNLYIAVTLSKGKHSSEVEITGTHTGITRIMKDGELIFSAKPAEIPEKKVSEAETDISELSVKTILEFADEVNLEDIAETIERQIEYNSAIAKEGIENPWGAEIGRTLLSSCDEPPIEIVARAYAAAGSDARMSGCSKAAVIISGSGNQGITASVPVIKYAEHLGVSHEKLIRSLAVSNLIAKYQKHFIGNLSAYCGATAAATGAGAGIAYLMGYGYDIISQQIINTIATIGGMICDGAKPSCASKISSALATSLDALSLAAQGKGFKEGEGIVKEDVDATVKSIGRMAREGMKSTDVEILNIMLGH